MLVWEGVVTRKGIETYDGKDGKKKEAIRFSVEQCGLVPDSSLTLEDLPEVGTHVRCLVNRVFLKEKKRDMYVYLGPAQPSPLTTAVAVPVNGNGTHAPVAATSVAA